MKKNKKWWKLLPFKYICLNTRKYRKKTQKKKEVQINNQNRLMENPNKWGEKAKAIFFVR